MVHFKFFLGNEMFLFVKIEAEIFSSVSLIHYFMKPHKISANLDKSLLPIQKCHLNVCLNELKFCKVSQNPKSNSCWKFQLSILTNKKVLFLKKFEVHHVPWIVLFSATRCRNISLTLLVYMALVLFFYKVEVFCSDQKLRSNMPM